MNPQSNPNMLDILPPPNKNFSSFHSMNILPSILQGIRKMKFRNPTSIQKKMIPSMMSGRDVFAMSRTGSGKTAGFLVPMLNRLGSHTTTVGIRAIVVSPARELAMQTDSVCRKLSFKTDLRIARLIGGDSLHEQFSSISRNPDVVIGTPGRIVHVLKEAKISLQSVQCVVFDEADRLFELGFEDQIRDIIRRCPSSHQKKQVVMVSATLPRILMGFMKEVSQNPLILRLDEARISPNLKMAFFLSRSREKWSVLLWLLRRVIREDDSTLVFAPTRHHAEYAKMLIEIALKGRECALIYGAMFADSRKQNLNDFRRRRKNILVVTDVAARGIDLPFLNNVIQLSLPSQPKLFLHRVGRAARAGRSGTSFSILCAEEIGYFMHLKKYLETSPAKNRVIKVSPGLEDMIDGNRVIQDAYDNYLGGVSQNILDFENERIQGLLKMNGELMTQFSTVLKAHRKFSQTRPPPMRGFVKAGQFIVSRPGIHPLVIQCQLLNEKDGMSDFISEQRVKNELRDVNIRQTVFEFGVNKGTDNDLMMKKLRMKHSDLLLPKKGDEDENDDRNNPNEKPKKLRKRRSRMRNNNNSNNNEEEEEEIDLNEEFKDRNMFLSYNKKDKASDLGTQIFSIEENSRDEDSRYKNDGQNSVIATSSERKAQTRLIWKKGKYQRIHIAKGERWDPIRKRGRKSSIQTDGKNYEKWRKKTGGRVQKVGELEKKYAFGPPPTFNEDEKVIKKLMNPGSGFHHSKGFSKHQVKGEDIDNNDNNNNNNNRINKNEGKKYGNVYDGDVLSDDRVGQQRRKRRKSKEHEKNAYMVRTNKKIKKKWHFEAMDRKREEIQSIQNKFKKKRVGKKRMREIQGKGITSRPRKRRKR